MFYACFDGRIHAVSTKAQYLYRGYVSVTLFSRVDFVKSSKPEV